MKVAALTALYAFSSPIAAHADPAKSNLKRSRHQLLKFLKAKTTLLSNLGAAKDDEAYWSRFLQDNVDMSAPTPPPTPSPPPPTPAPTPPPSDTLCTVTVDAECTPLDGSPDCGSIPVLTTLCEATPKALIMKYNGGDCDQSFNTQIGTPLFKCSDLGEGPPPTEEGVLSYIVVTDTLGKGIVYFEGFVPVGGQFPLVDPTDPTIDLEANMNVTIYSSDDTSPGNILQTLIYHTSCSSNLFLKDIFGSIQLAFFSNPAQGNVSCFVDATFDFAITNEGTTDAELRSLVSITNLGVFNFTDDILGRNLMPDETFVVKEEVTIDLTERLRYTALTTISAASTTGLICEDTDFLSFVAGNPAPPGFPTAAPSEFGLPTP